MVFLNYLKTYSLFLLYVLSLAVSLSTVTVIQSKYIIG